MRYLLALINAVVLGWNLRSLFLPMDTFLTALLVFAILINISVIIAYSFKFKYKRGPTND